MVYVMAWIKRWKFGAAVHVNCLSWDIQKFLCISGLNAIGSLVVPASHFFA